MINNRAALLEILIENITKTISCMHAGNSFPFGDFMLRKQQVMILMFIFEKKGIASVKDIANFLHVTPGAVTQFVDGLVEKKLVNREKNIKDGRIINIKISAAAEKKFNKFKLAYLEAASKSFSKLSDKELVEFIKITKKIQASAAAK